MTFDPTKETDIEEMTDADFGVWKAARQSEIAIHAGGGLSSAARTMLTMAVNAYTEAANALREVAELETSRNPLGLSRHKKPVILKQHRSLFEIGRKLFVFATVNATGGLQTAAKVVEVEASSMSAEEKKKYEAANVRKRPYASQYGSQNGSQYGNAAASTSSQQTRDSVLQGELRRLLGLPAGKANPADRSICFNCQEVGHFAKHCTKPARAKQPRVEANPE